VIAFFRPLNRDQRIKSKVIEATRRDKESLEPLLRQSNLQTKEEAVRLESRESKEVRTGVRRYAGREGIKGRKPFLREARPTSKKRK